ncbi:MAG: hypothetical protein AAGI09_10290 [Pseudomonadota bacterium]
MPLRETAAAILARVTPCLITHFHKGHFDHLDPAVMHWLRSRALPVVCTPRDAVVLAKTGLRTLPLYGDPSSPQAFFEGSIRTTPCTHGED